MKNRSIIVKTQVKCIRKVSESLPIFFFYNIILKNILVFSDINFGCDWHHSNEESSLALNYSCLQTERVAYKCFEKNEIGAVVFMQTNFAD